jgi:ribonuclease BN (tRNA processing enzyme)
VPLTLTVLGCAGSTYDADLQHPCSSYLLESPRAAVILDCGFGSFASYLEGTSSTRIDAIFVSHAHRDHSFDIEAFITFPSAWRDRPRVLASRATIGALQFDIDSTEAEVIVIEDGSVVDIGTFRFECSATTHQMPTLATHVSLGGSRVVYSSDTGPGWTVPSTFHAPDVAILECTLESRGASSSPFHLDAEEVAMLAQSLDARTTLLTHVPPRENGQVRLVMAKQAAPECEIVLAATGQRLLIGSREL